MEISRIELKEFLDLLISDIQNKTNSLYRDLDIVWGLDEQVALYKKILHLYFIECQKERVRVEEEYKKERSVELKGLKRAKDEKQKKSH